MTNDRRPAAKGLAVLAVLALIPALAGCRMEEPVTAESEKPASFYANMYAGNYMTQCGETVFYLEPEDDRVALYARAAGAQTGTQIAADVARYFVTDQAVFYETAEEDGLYRMDHRGKHAERISDETPFELVAMGEEIYFTTYDRETGKQAGQLYRAARDGTQAEAVQDSSRVYNLFPYQGALYFCAAADRESEPGEWIDFGNQWYGTASDGKYPMDGTIYRYAPGEKAAAPEAVDGPAHVKRFLIADGRIYWMGLQLWQTDLSGGEGALCVDADTLTDSAAMNLCGDALYYGADNARVDRYDLRSGTAATVWEEPVSALWAAEDWVYAASAQDGTMVTVTL